MPVRLFLSNSIPRKAAKRMAVVSALLAVCCVLAGGFTPVQAQGNREYPFRATNYEVQVLLHPDDQTISGLAKVEFTAQQASRTVVVQLHQDLKVNKVNVPGGKPLEFERDNLDPMRLTIGLPDAVAPGKTSDAGIRLHRADFE